jgi:ADP-ribose pyrophosphatase YjhB (NUDIX family)
MPKYRWNRYHDLEIDLARFRIDTETELSDLIYSETAKWETRIRGRRGEDAAVLWIRIPEQSSHFLTWFLRHSFTMHHAVRDHIMVVRPKSTRAVIPLYGTHYARVECVVIEQGTGRILMVREQVGPADAYLKLVTGSVELNEYISRAAVREVREETGVSCSLVGLLGMGNRLGTRFGRDEILIGVLLSAPQGQTPRGDGREICEAIWAAPEEALSRGSPPAKEWLIAANRNKSLRCGYLGDFRGPPHKIEVFLPCEEEKMPDTAQ